jgi:TPR repeat protein
MRKLLASLFLIITLGMAQGAKAGPFEDGWAAQSRGDYATAVSLYRLAAAQGNADAQFHLGLMYLYCTRISGHKVGVKRLA